MKLLHFLDTVYVYIGLILRAIWHANETRVHGSVL